MQAEIESGAKLEDVAQKSSLAADDGIISGFSLGVAVELLSKTWEYGEALRQWHNLYMQVGNKDGVANKRGGVLNPAPLRVG